MQLIKKLFIIAPLFLLAGCSMPERHCGTAKVVDIEIECKDGKSGCTYISTLDNGSVMIDHNYEPYINADGYYCK